MSFTERSWPGHTVVMPPAWLVCLSVWPSAQSYKFFTVLPSNQRQCRISCSVLSTFICCPSFKTYRRYEKASTAHYLVRSCDAWLGFQSDCKANMKWTRKPSETCSQTWAYPLRFLVVFFSLPGLSEFTVNKRLWAWAVPCVQITWLSVLLQAVLPENTSAPRVENLLAWDVISVGNLKLKLISDQLKLILSFHFKNTWIAHDISG